MNRGAVPKYCCPAAPLAVSLVLTWPWKRVAGRLGNRLRRRIYVDDFAPRARAEAGAVAEAAEAAREALPLQGPAVRRQRGDASLAARANPWKPGPP